MQNAATVRELSDKFFSGKGKTAVDQTVESVTEKEMNSAPLAAARPSVPAGFETLGMARNEALMEAATDEASQPDGLHPRGSFVDVRA